MDGSSFSDLEGLSKLLESSQKLNEEAAGGSGIAGGARALGPGDIGPSKAEVAPAGRAKAVTKDIWGDDDVKEGDLFSTHVDPSDKRPEPSYKVVYSQSVGSSDVFLGMSGKDICSFPFVFNRALLTANPGKDPSTMSCDRLTVSVVMPGTAFKDVSLDVQGDQFLVRAPHYKLALHLQHEVDDKQGSAKWDGDTCTLNVSLPIVRPSDFFHPSMDPSRLM